MVGKVAVQFKEKKHRTVANFAIGEITWGRGRIVKPCLDHEDQYKSILDSRVRSTYRPASKVTDSIFYDFFGRIS
jgi:hypothetical protein